MNWISRERLRLRQHGGIAPRFTGVPIASVGHILTSGSKIATHFLVRGALFGIGQQLDPDNLSRRWLALGTLALLVGLTVLASGTLQLGLLLVLGSPLFLYALPRIPDPVMENRTYLTLPGIAVIAASLSDDLWMPPIAIVYGLIAFHRNDYWRTRYAFWKQASRESPAKLRPRINYAVAMSKNDEMPAAIEIYKTIVESADPQPEGALAASNLALLYLEQHKRTNDQEWLRAAVELLHYSINVWPDHPRLRYTRGCVFMGFGRWPEAILEFDVAVEKHKKFAEAFRMRARCWGRLSNAENALADAQKAEVIDGIHGVLRFESKEKELMNAQ